MDAANAERTSQRIPLLILLTALIIGGGLRFYRLGADEMNQAEAAAWMAASAPTLRSAIARGRLLDPGSLGTHNVMLHGWIVAFGDQVGAMRLPSAILGTLSIPLLFGATREILSEPGNDTALSTASLAGAFAALLFACNLLMVQQGARLMRMYPLMLTAIFAQIFFFARTWRRGGLLNCLAAAVFAALAASSNYTALFVMAGEAVWLAYLYFFPNSPSERASIKLPVASLVIGAFIVAPLALSAISVGVGALHRGTYQTIEWQPPWWPFRAIQQAFGNSAVWPLALLALYGTWSLRDRLRRAIGLLWCWTLIPFAIVLAIAYLITPFMLERYLIASMAALLALAALGLAAIANQLARYAIAALVVVLSLAHIHHHWRAPEDVQWREAARFASSIVPPGQNIVVMPPGEPLRVLGYYLPPARQNLIVGADAHFDAKSRLWSFDCGTEPVAIVQAGLPREFVQKIQACYPRELAKFRMVEVLAH